MKRRMGFSKNIASVRRPQSNEILQFEDVVFRVVVGMETQPKVIEQLQQHVSRSRLPSQPPTQLSRGSGNN